MRSVMTRMKPMLNAGSLVLALSLMGSQALAADIRTIEVTAEEFAFKPATVQVDPGETIRLKLVNKGNMSHNLHLREQDKKTDTIQAGKSDTVEVTAPRDGELGFFCAIPGHKKAGMKGKIVVQ